MQINYLNLVRILSKLFNQEAMNVLWITNILFPEAEVLLDKNYKFKESGGWLMGAAHSILNYSNIKLSVATTSSKVNRLEILEGEKITYFVFPLGRGRDIYNEEYEEFWLKIKQKLKPDIVHIHGTEYTHGLAYVKTCGSDKVVVSIQGLKSLISRYYLKGLEDIYHGRLLTFHDFITGGLSKEKKTFEKSGIFERELIKSVSYVIGRTSWDKAHVWAINPNATYYQNNETLRPEFYTAKSWSYSNCVKHTIFVSQANYPIKGLHQVLRALLIVRKIYPDVVVRVAGKNVTEWIGFKGFLRYNGYGRIIKRIIKEYDLNRNVVFLGNLDASEMCFEYLRANLFICPSSIENSPNSLGEAQLLGTPCLSSYVGGTPDFMCGNDMFLYRFEEVEMLAYKIIQIFKAGDIQNNMYKIAQERHNPKKNAEDLLAIYGHIMGN